MASSIVGTVPTGRAELGEKTNGKKWNNNTKFEPEFCQMIIDMGREGSTFPQFAVACGVSERTAKNWRDSFPEWDEAVELALSEARAFLNSRAYANLEWVNAKDEPQIRVDLWKELSLQVRPPAEVVYEADREAEEAVETVIKGIAKRIQKGEI